jgi:hypothetical protein
LGALDETRLHPLPPTPSYQGRGSYTGLRAKK